MACVFIVGIKGISTILVPRGRETAEAKQVWLVLFGTCSINFPIIFLSIIYSSTLDSGAAGNFLDINFMLKHGIPTKPFVPPVKMLAIDGSSLGNGLVFPSLRNFFCLWGITLRVGLLYHPLHSHPSYSRPSGVTGTQPLKLIGSPASC